MEAKQSPKEGGKRNKKRDKSQHIPRMLDFLFTRGGLAEKSIATQADAFVNVYDILDVYSDLTEEDVYEVVSSDDKMQFRQCPDTNQLQIKMNTTPPDTVDTAATDSLSTSSHPITTPNPGARTCDTSHPGAASRVPKQHEKLGRDHVRLSKYMSYILRHGAEKEGFRLQPGGFLYVDEILEKKRRQFSVEDVESVVANNEKNRFYMEAEPETGRLRIRANQGHTVEVHDLELKRIDDPEEFPIVVHGTYKRCLKNIKSQGLSRMKRNHIHMAQGEPGESGVISGMRGSCDVIIYVNLKKAMEDGIEFFVSSNNVILSSGDQEGFLKPKYFSSIKQRYK